MIEKTLSLFTIMSTTPAKPRKAIKKIAIAGAGGLGSHLAHFLYDFGVNRNQFDFVSFDIDQFDDDTVDTKNLLHQNFTQDDLNKPKARVMADRYMVNAKERLMTKDDFKNYDLIFSCVDSMVFRKELYEYCWSNENSPFWIDGRCESRQACLFTKDVPREKLEAMLSDSKERTGCLRAYEKENNVSHLTPIVVSARMAQVFLNYLRGETTAVHSIFMI